MLTTVEAIHAIRQAMPSLDGETVALDESIGRVLRQPVHAERDQPPFDRVMMDGIAIRFADFDDGRRKFPVQSRQHAGDTAHTLEPGKCIEIMTGACLPAGADCIVPVERLSVSGGVAQVEAGYGAELRQHIHERGSDHAEGALLLRPGARIAPADIAIIASAGLPAVEVSRLPAIRVISTGNELVPAGQPIEAHQIRESNGPAVIAMLRQHGYSDCEHDHLVDDVAVLESRIAKHLDEADVLVLSGGVSMGKADFVPQVLETLGVEVVFHKVSQRPGRPMWFGIGPRKQAVFALPGNPVSTLVCCRHYVMPALANASGASPGNPEFAALAQDVAFRPSLTLFLPVRLVSNAAGTLLALPVQTNTSGDFASLTGTDGYVELALADTFFETGTTVPLYRW
ncbi:MAG TPA: molybdopterin molybdotransferase MoeA [Woeseiaceae bacterium]|nr:molybdopterin molybdotransferase MoeA [Woeseiaceae bacterium]